jgi:hypothetical protein
MQSKDHDRARRLADKALVEGISGDEKEWFDRHTIDCGECARYWQVSTRIIRGINAFSVVLTPGTNVRMQDAVAKCAAEGVSAATTNDNTQMRSSLTDRSAGVLEAATPKVARFAFRRVVIVGAAIAAAALLMVRGMSHDSLRVERTETHQQSAPQLVVASANSPSPLIPSASSISTENIPALARIKPRVQKAMVAKSDFIRLDDGPPVVDGTIMRINMPDSFAVRSGRGRKGKGVPAEVLVDEMGVVRAIRFLD